MPFNYPPRNFLKKPRPNTKRSKLLQLLKIGITFEEIQEEFGWDKITAYEGVYLIHKLLGYGIKQNPESLELKVYLNEESTDKN